MQERCKRTRIHHKLGRFPVNRTIHIQIEIVAYLNRNRLQAAPVETRQTAQDVGVGLHDEQLPLTIQHRLGWEKNIRSNNSVDFLFVNQSRCAGRVAQVDGDHRFINQG